ncbi:MAG: hypothetical protein WBC60_15550 [Cognaticolwellia sp.]|jgi:hypothetical protein
MSIFSITIGLILLMITGISYSLLIHFSGEDSFGFGMMMHASFIFLALLLIVPSSIFQAFNVLVLKDVQSNKSKVIWLMGLVITVGLVTLIFL